MGKVWVAELLMGRSGEWRKMLMMCGQVERSQWYTHPSCRGRCSCERDVVRIMIIVLLDVARRSRNIGTIVRCAQIDKRMMVMM